MQGLILPFIARADTRACTSGLTKAGANQRSSLVERHEPQKLVQLLDVRLADEGTGEAGILRMLERILRYSVNTWDQGFMHKLSASTNPIGVISEYVLSVLNANVCGLWCLKSYESY